MKTIEVFQTLETLEDVRILIGKSFPETDYNEFNGYSEMRTAVDQYFKNIAENATETLNFNEIKTERFLFSKFYIESLESYVSVNYYKSYSDNPSHDELVYFSFIID